MKAFLRKRTSSQATPPPRDIPTSPEPSSRSAAGIETPLYARFAKTAGGDSSSAPTRPVVSGPMPLVKRPSTETPQDDRRKRTQSSRTRTTSTSQSSSRHGTPARSPPALSPMSSRPSLPEQTSSSSSNPYFKHARAATSLDEPSGSFKAAKSPLSSRPTLPDEYPASSLRATARVVNARGPSDNPATSSPLGISSDAPRIPSAILPEENALRFMSLADSGFFDSPSRTEKPLPPLTPPKNPLPLPLSASSSQRTIPSNIYDTPSHTLATPPPAPSAMYTMLRTRKTNLRSNDDLKNETPTRSPTAVVSPRTAQPALPPERGRASEEARVGRDGLGPPAKSTLSSSPPKSARLTASAGAFSVTTLHAGDPVAKDAYIPSSFVDQRLHGAAQELTNAAAPRRKMPPEVGNGRQNINETQMQREREATALYRQPLSVPAPSPPTSAYPPPRNANPAPALSPPPPPPAPPKPERERRKLRKTPSTRKQDHAPTPPPRDIDEQQQRHHQHHHDQEPHHHHAVLHKVHPRAEPAPHLPVLTPPQSPDGYAPASLSPPLRFEQLPPRDEFASRTPPRTVQQQQQPRGPVRGRPLIFANMNGGAEDAEPTQSPPQQAPVRRGPLIFNTRDHEEQVEAAWEKQEAQRLPSPEREREEKQKPAQLKAAGNLEEEWMADAKIAFQGSEGRQALNVLSPRARQEPLPAPPQAQVPSQPQVQPQPQPQVQQQPQIQSQNHHHPQPSVNQRQSVDYSRPRYKSLPNQRQSQQTQQELPPIPPPVIGKDELPPMPAKQVHQLHRVNKHIGDMTGRTKPTQEVPVNGKHADEVYGNGETETEIRGVPKHRPITPVSPKTPQQTLHLGDPIQLEPSKSVAESDALDLDSTAATVSPTPRTSIVISPRRPLPSLPPPGGLQTPSDDGRRRTPSPVKDAQQRQSVASTALSGDFEPVTEMQGYASDAAASRPSSSFTLAPGLSPPPVPAVPSTVSQPALPARPPTPPSPEEYSAARTRRRGNALPKAPPPALETLIEQTRPRTPPPPTFYPLSRHMHNPVLLSSLLYYLTFRDWLALWSVNKQLRGEMEESRALREEVLERFLSVVGYARWPSAGSGEDGKDKWDRDEPIKLSLRYLAAYMQGVSLPPHAYARIPPQPDLIHAMKRATRAYTRVVLRLREQAEAEDRALSLARRHDRVQGHGRQRSEGPPPSWSNGASGIGRRSVSRQSSRAPSPTFSTYSHGNGSHTQLSTPSRSNGSSASNGGRFQSPLFRLRRAPLLRVFVPSPEGDWLSDASVLECEAELKKAGVLPLLRVGDVVWDTAVGDEGNVGRLIWDGRYLIDLDYTYSQTGDLPGYLPNLAFPPSYFHRVIRTAGEHKNPIVHVDVAPWGEEIASNLQLLQDRVRTETPQGTYHTVVRWTHRSSFHIRPQHPRTRAHPSASPFSVTLPTGERRAIDPGWAGIVVVEAEGTNEGLADLQRRCGQAFPPRVGSDVKGERERGVWRILRERSRPGEIWIRTVSYKERLIP